MQTDHKVSDPTPKRLSKQIGDMVDKDLESIGIKFVVKDQDPDEWLKPLTKAIDEKFVQHVNDIPTSYNHLIETKIQKEK